MRLRPVILLVFLCGFYNAASQETTETTFGKGMLNLVAKDSSWSVKFAPRIQFRATSQWDYTDGQYGEATQNFLIRRARLKFDGFVYSPKLQYKLQLGFSNRDISGASRFTGNAPRIILDAVLMWNFHQNFELWAGQAKLPGNIEGLVSSGSLQLIDRSLLNQYFEVERDLGFQLHHFTKLSENLILREKISVSQGEGRNVTTGNLGGHQYTGRLELLPFGEFSGNSEFSQSDLKREASPKLMLGASYNFNNNAVKTEGNQGDYMFTSNGFHETDITTFFVDAVFKYRGFSFMGEFADRDAENPVAVNENGNPATDADGNLTNHYVIEGNAINLQLGYLFKNNYEISGRFTQVDFKGTPAAETEVAYTLGVSKYLVGHNLKFQTDITYGTFGNTSDFIEYRMGFDLHF